MYSKIQYISSGITVDQQLEHITAVLQRGIGWVQLRFKHGDSSSVLELAKKVKLLQNSYSFTFIINDHIDIACEVDADGVHLGLHDDKIATARRKLGNKIIGGTANTITDIIQRMDEGCDYIGAGPLRFTRSKENLSPILGFEGYRKIFSHLADVQAPPIYAIGGVTFDDIPILSTIGVHGVAMSNALECNTSFNSYIENHLS